MVAEGLYHMLARLIIRGAVQFAASQQNPSPRLAAVRTPPCFTPLSRVLSVVLFAVLLAGPLNWILGTMRISVSQWIAVAAGVLIIGPVLLKMSVGHPFATFRLEANRGGTGAPPDLVSQ
jgi:hypothetical protein